MNWPANNLADHVFLAWLWSCLYGKFVVHRDGPDGKRCSLIVSNGRKRILGVFGAEQGRVVGKVNHDVWMPMAHRSKHLVRRPHVGKTHVGALGDLAFGVGGLYPLGNLLGCLTFQPPVLSEVRNKGVRFARLVGRDKWEPEFLRRN